MCDNSLRISSTHGLSKQKASASDVSWHWNDTYLFDSAKTGYHSPLSTKAAPLTIPPTLGMFWTLPMPSGATCGRKPFLIPLPLQINGARHRFLAAHSWIVPSARSVQRTTGEAVNHEIDPAPIRTKSGSIKCTQALE